MPERPPPTTSRRARLLLLAGTCLFALLLCELVVRLGGFVPRVHAIWREDPESIYQRSTNPILGHELKPSFSREFPRGRATSNSHGFRDRERTPDKPAGRRRILMLGDSVVEGVNYVADEDTLSRQLENVLTNTEVLNLGVSGYCTLAEVELLATRGLPFEPDDVFVVFTGNDFQNVVPEHTVSGGVAARPGWAKHLFLHSALFRLCCLRLNWFSFAEEQDPVARNRDAIGENNVVDGLARLRELANQHNFRVLVIAWPSFTPDTIRDFEADDGDPLLIERLARMQGLPTARLGPAFRRHLDGLPSPVAPDEFYTVVSDGMHPNARSTRIAAGALKQLLDSGHAAPPYLPGPVDVDAVTAARVRGGQDDVPEDASLVERTFLSLRYQGRLQESEAYLREVTRSEPDNLFANAYLGRLLGLRGEYAEAVGYLDHAVRLKPDAPDLRVALAEALFHAQGAAPALNTLAAGLQMQPQNPHLRLAAANVLLQEGRFADARREIDRILQVAPEFPGARELGEQITNEAARPK